MVGRPEHFAGRVGKKPGLFQAEICAHAHSMGKVGPSFWAVGGLGLLVFLVEK